MTLADATNEVRFKCVCRKDKEGLGAVGRIPYTKKLHSNNHCVLPKPQLFHFRSCFLINLYVKTPKS